MTNETEANTPDDLAMKIIMFYRAKVKAKDQTRGRAKKNIIKLLMSFDYRNLMLAAMNYSRSDDLPEQEKYRIGVGNFFGRDAHWEWYASLPEIPEGDDEGCDYEPWFDELEG